MNIEMLLSNLFDGRFVTIDMDEPNCAQDGRESQSREFKVNDISVRFDKTNTHVSLLLSNGFWYSSSDVKLVPIDTLSEYIIVEENPVQQEIVELDSSKVNVDGYMVTYK